MKYFLTIGGIKYDFANLHFGRIVGIDSIPFSAKIFPARGSLLPTFDSAILVEKEINNITLTKFQGKVTHFSHVPLEDGSMVIEGFDLKRKIDYLAAKNEGYASSKGSTIFTTEITPSSATDLTAGSVDTTDLVLDSINLGKSGSGNSRLTRKAVFQLLEMVSDRDIYVQRNGVTDFLNGAGTNRTTTHILEHGVNGKLDSDVGYGEDETRRVKQVIVKGSGVGALYHLGSAGTPLSTDKIRQIELPFLVTDDTCSKAATNLLAELDQTVKFAKFYLDDLFATNYDVYDTIKLKARLPNKTIDENLKIFSINTIVAGGEEMHEQTTLLLSNFRRSAWAKLVNPFEVAKGNEQLSGLSLGSTQAQVQVENAGGASFIQENSVGGADVVVTTTESEIHANTAFNSTKTAGGFFYVSLIIIARKFGLGTGRLQLRLTDGTNFFPASPFYLFVRYNPFVGMLTRITVAFHIPNNLASKTLSLRGKTSDGEVEVVAEPYYSTIGEHTH